MYRKDHMELARAIRSTAQADSSITYTTVKSFADSIANAIAARSPKESQFDREVFMALATQREG